MKDLKVRHQLPALSFDYAGAKAWAEQIAAQYKDVVVREEDIAGIKSEMAGLNKLKAELESARKQAVAQVSEPIKEFEVQVKEIVDILADTRAFLDEQVKAHEQRQREERRHAVQFQIDHALHEHGVTDLNIEIEDRWLNKTAKDKDIKAGIDAIILKHLKEKKEAEQLAQARKDRALAIEEKVAAMNAATGHSVRAAMFVHLHDLDLSLSDVNAEIEGHFAKLQAVSAPPKPAPAPMPEPAAQQPAGPPAPRGQQGPPMPVRTTRWTYSFDVNQGHEAEFERAIVSALGRYCNRITRHEPVAEEV